MKKLFCVLLLLLLAPRLCVAASSPKASMLINLSTGQTLYEHNANMPLAPASLTKIMTMYLTLDAIRQGKLGLNQKLRIPAEAAKTGGSAMKLIAGEDVPVVRLLAGMAVASGNDAATALAMKLGGSMKNFAGQMNRKAKSLGMKNTVFKNATGLPAAGHKTTARDLALLCRAYLRTHPEARRFHSMGFFMHKGAISRNTNPLLGRVEGVDGLKTGWTVASGYNLITTAKRGNTRLLAIVLGCASRETRDRAAVELLETGFKYPRNPAEARRHLDVRPAMAAAGKISAHKKQTHYIKQ